MAEDSIAKTFGGTHVVEHLASEPEDSLREIADIVQRVDADRGIRIRTSLYLWNPEAEVYAAWRGQIWKLNVKNRAEAQAFGEALEAFFDCFSHANVRQVRDVMRADLKELHAQAAQRGPLKPTSEPATGAPLRDNEVTDVP